MSKEGKKFVLGTLIAATVGAVAGVLFAPKSGKETREDLKKGARKTIAEADKKLRTVHEELNGHIEKFEDIAKRAGNKVSQEATDALGKAKKAQVNTAAVLAAVRSGNCTDEDLRQALQSAKEAKAALATFLKK